MGLYIYYIWILYYQFFFGLSMCGVTDFMFIPNALNTDGMSLPSGFVLQKPWNQHWLGTGESSISTENAAIFDFMGPSNNWYQSICSGKQISGIDFLDFQAWPPPLPEIFRQRCFNLGTNQSFGQFPVVSHHLAESEFDDQPVDLRGWTGSKTTN